MKPYYEQDGITIYHGDAREVLPELRGDAVITDPPYGETSLDWDRWVDGWPSLIRGVRLLWTFGSFRMFWENRDDFEGWKFAQDIVWEKHNGSGFATDRFKRVHEIALQFYRGPWGDVYKDPVFTADATKRTVRRQSRPPHTGAIGNSTYQSHDGGPRMMRSVLQVRSCQGSAEHPTQKPLGIIKPLIQYSVPPGGLVVDPFMGSGSVLIAAKELGRKAAGVEGKEIFCEVAAKRLAQGVLPLEGVA